VYSGISTASRIVRSGDQAIERMDEIRSAQSFLRSELAQALAVPFDETDDGDPIVFSGTSRTLRYVAPMPGYLSKLGPQLQTVSLVDDGRQSYRLEVTLAMLPPDGGAPQPVGEPEVLLRGIRKGSISYRGMDDQNRPGDWQESWDDGRRTPSLVRIELDVGGNIVFPTLVAPIRIDASASRNGLSLTRGTRGPVIR
jgi:general secretion pathway protein J